jgi:Fic family protein
VPPPLARPAPGATDPLSPLLDLPGVTDALAAAREAVDRLLNHRALRRQSAAVSSESALRGARASAALEGSTVSLGSLRAGEIHDPVVLGALRVSSGLGALVPVWERAPLQAIARLHVLAAAGAVPDQHLGRPAATADGDRLVALARLVSGSQITPGILLAAVVHGELVTVDPFGSVDGVVARAAARLTMITRGVDPKSVSVPEVGHLEHANDYRAALSSYSTGEPTGVAEWLRHYATAVQLGAQEGLAICEAVLRG